MQKVIMWFAILAVMVLAVLNIIYEPPTVADVFYPIANQRISWEK